jgi:E3 ubiquitin-protein ligase HERC2
MRSRFAVLKMINQLIAGIVLPAADLSEAHSWSLGNLVCKLKRILFFEAKLAILNQQIQQTLSKEKEPQIVILNRHEADKAGSSLKSTLFVQLYNQLKVLDPQVLRRKGPSWRVKFVGEGGHDVGGLFNTSLTDICSELMSSRLPLFVRTPNGVNNVGEFRDKFVPNPSCTNPIHLDWFEFFGRLIGITLLSQSRTIPVDLSSIFWKRITREPLALDDLKALDYPTWKTINLLKDPESEGVTADNFEDFFEDVYFIADSCLGEGEEVELVKGGKLLQVCYENRLEFAEALQKYRLTEFDVQIGAICRGISSLVQFDLLSLFTWQQLETMVCGTPEVDIRLLKEKTVYHGDLKESDRHIRFFWEVLEEFSANDRKAFLQFVWGRSRLPSTKVGFGKDFFRVTDHAASMIAGYTTGGANMHFPVAHTCFFQIELPRYTNKEILRRKLMYAIHNCKNIDGDTTHESMMNLNMAWEGDDEEENAAPGNN